MKKLVFLTVLVFVLAFAVWAVAEKAEDKLDVKCTQVKEAVACGEGQQKCKTACNDIFKKHHEELICQLTKIRNVAVKENALQTSKALDELITNKQKQLSCNKAGLCKDKCCPSDCIKSSCATKIKSGTCPKLKDSKGCPSGCIKSCCAEKQKSGTCPRTECKKTCSDK